MDIKLKVNNTELDISIPGLCPHCNFGVEPKYLYHSELTNNHTALLLQCPHCGEYIFYKCYCDFNTRTGILRHYSSKIKYTPDFSKEINDISPRFIDIFTQSMQAMYDGYNELIGIGFRKSLEFLIKDYLINVKHEDVSVITKMSLGSIFNKINDPTIKPLVTAITWIGNDETHYIRKYEDKTIDDMLKFIYALIHYISIELISSDAYSFVKGSIKG